MAVCVKVGAACGNAKGWKGQTCRVKNSLQPWWVHNSGQLDSSMQNNHQFSSLETVSMWSKQRGSFPPVCGGLDVAALNKKNPILWHWFKAWVSSGNMHALRRQTEKSPFGAH